MPDPQPAFGRFTDPIWEVAPRDDYEWLCAAEDALRHAQAESSPRKRLALLERVIECIEHAKSEA